MRQSIIIIGGYNSLWPGYLKMARDLEDVSGLAAVAVPLLPWDWYQATRASDGTKLLDKLVETVEWSRRRNGAERFILVGHSAGGLIARLYLSEQPVWGRAYHGLEHVSAVISLGTPHCCVRKPLRQQEAAGNWFLVEIANRLVPGATHAGRVHYCAVAGQSFVGRRHGTPRERRALRLYRLLGGGDGRVWGDGIVPIHCAQLDGAETLILEGVAHSAKVSRDWYGASPGILRRWWNDELGHAR